MCTGIWCLTSQRAAESWAFSLYNEIHESSDPAAGAVKVLGFVLWIKNSPGRILCSGKPHNLTSEIFCESPALPLWP